MSDVPSVPSTGLAIDMVTPAVSASKIFRVEAVVSAVTDVLLVAAVKVAIIVSVNSILASSTMVKSIVAVVVPAGIVTVPATVVASV